MDDQLRVERGVLVPLGYGKYFRAESIVGLLPIEEERGPGRRTWVYIEGLAGPVVASRTESTILRDMTGSSEVATRAVEQRDLLLDILDAIESFDPVLRNIVREQGHWDLSRLEARIRDVLRQGD